MKRAFLSLTLLLIATSAHAGAPEWSMKVYDGGALPGDVVPYRFAWTNTSASAVRVPADLFTQLAPSSAFNAGMIHERGVAPRIVPLATDPASVRWVTVQPGESLQALGTLADYFARCAGGCQRGTYRLELTPAARHWSALAEDQRDPQPPAFVWQRELQAAPDTVVPIGPGPGLSVTMHTLGRGSDGVRVRVSITNKTAVAIWFPRALVTIDWSVRMTFTNAPEAAARDISATSGMAAWSERDAVLVRPGSAVSWLATVDPGEGTHAFATAFVRATYPFEPAARGLASPFYFNGTVTSGELQIR